MSMYNIIKQNKKTYNYNNTYKLEMEIINYFGNLIEK